MKTAVAARGLEPKGGDELSKGVLRGGASFGGVVSALRRRPPGTLLASAVLALGAVPVAHVSWASAATASPTPPPISSIGKQDVTFIAVSPAYQHTGLVVAMATAIGDSQCGNNCTHLWVSHDGGAHWAQAASQGWNQGRPVIAVDAKGHEALFAVTPSSVQRSTDAGATWQVVSGNGGLTATPSPTYPSDHALAVSSTSKDMLINDKGIHQVDGSSGAYTDFAFAFSPAFPSGGAHHPALLAAIDPNTHIPFVQQCDGSLHCTGQAALPGATNQSAPATVYTSPHYHDDGVAFVQTARGIYKSSDGGDTFVPLTVAPANGATATATPAIDFAPGYDDHGSNRTLYAAVLQVYDDMKSPHTGGGVFRSDDGGSTWRADNGDSLMDGGATTVAVAPDGRLFAGYLRLVGGVSAAGMLCSADGGASWQAFCSPVGDAQPATAHTGKAANPAPAGQCFGAGCASTPAANAGSTPQAADNGPSSSGSANGGVHNAAATVLGPPASGRSTLLIVAIAIIAVVAALAVAAAVRKRAAAKKHTTGGT